MAVLQKEIKAQPVRLWDIFILAPILIYAGTRKVKLSDNVKSFLVSAAVGIFVYETKNYLEIKQRETEAKRITSLPAVRNENVT